MSFFSFPLSFCPTSFLVIFLYFLWNVFSISSFMPFLISFLLSFLFCVLYSFFFHSFLVPFLPFLPSFLQSYLIYFQILLSSACLPSVFLHFLPCVLPWFPAVSNFPGYRCKVCRNVCSKLLNFQLCSKR